MPPDDFVRPKLAVLRDRFEVRRKFRVVTDRDDDEAPGAFVFPRGAPAAEGGWNGRGARLEERRRFHKNRYASKSGRDFDGSRKARRFQSPRGAEDFA